MDRKYDRFEGTGWTLKRLFLFIFLLLIIGVKGVQAADAITVNNVVVRTLPEAIWGVTFNGFAWANGSRSDLDGDGSIASTYTLTNFTAARNIVLNIYTNSQGYVSVNVRGDLGHEYCMTNNATENGHCNAANPQSLANMKNMTTWLNSLNGSVDITLALLHSRYEDGDTTKPCSSSGLNCPPDDYNYRASTIISALKLAGYCPTWCNGTPNRTLTISQWNEPYNAQYWLNNLTPRTDLRVAAQAANCTLASVEFNNFIEKDYAAMETARIREGYQWSYSTPSWPVRSSAGINPAHGFNDCGTYMQDLFNERFSPATNGSINWTYYEVHPYSNVDIGGGWTRNPALFTEAAAYVRSYGYSKIIFTETAENGNNSGGHDTSLFYLNNGNDTYLNNSYIASAITFVQDPIFERQNKFTFSNGYKCIGVNGSNSELSACYYMWSELEGMRAMGYAEQAIVDCMEGGSVIYNTTTTSGVSASLARLKNGTYCLSSAYAVATGSSTLNITFPAALGVTKMVNFQNGTQITVTNNFANLGTYNPGTIGMYYLEANATTSTSTGVLISSTGNVIIINGKVLFR